MAMFALSESVMKNCPKRPLAEKSRWRHIRLAIKSRYLGNHAFQIKSCYGTLSGSHGFSFIIRHEKSPEAPPGGGLTITSCPVDNTTPLSRKPCMVKSCYGSLTGSHGHSIRIRHEKVCAAFPGGGLTMKSCPVGNKTSISQKPCIADKKSLWITIMKSWSISHFY